MFANAVGTVDDGLSQYYSAVIYRERLFISAVTVSDRDLSAER
jgi:hypothetical protein